MKKYSNYWQDDFKAEKPIFKSAEGEFETDVLIIGGGMAGILIAKRLSELGIDYMLVEANEIGSGTTFGTTAVVTAQHDTLYTDIKDSFDAETARLYLRANLDAVRRFESLAESIPCDYEVKPSFMVTRSRIEAKVLRNETELLNSFGFGTRYHTDTELPYRIAGAVEFPEMAQIQPLKLLYGVAKKLNVFEHTFITRIRGNTAYSHNAEIHAKHIVVATHFPFINKHGMYFMKLYQNRSFVMAFEDAQELSGTYVDTAEGGVYLRSHGSTLIVGGGDHRTGKKGKEFDHVEDFVRAYMPELNGKRRYSWATQDCMSLDGIPYIGRYSKNTPRLYVATGFNEWGMTSSMIASEIIPDLIMERENEFSKVFEPARTMLRKQFFINLGESFINIIAPSTKRCSHLGCTLKWNAREHTWDCPCHGSRFEKSGELISNPAMKNAKIK